MPGPDPVVSAPEPSIGGGKKVGGRGKMSGDMIPILASPRAARNWLGVGAWVVNLSGSDIRGLSFGLGLESRLESYEMRTLSLAVR